MSEGYGTKPTPFCCFQKCKLIIDKVFSCLKEGGKTKRTACHREERIYFNNRSKSADFLKCFCLWFLVVYLKLRSFLSRRLQLTFVKKI